ncbi:MAG: S46 family peptidase [Bacteroidota bacterium]
MKLLRSLVLLLCITMISPLRADEGMWIPALLGVLNEAEMQSMGLKLTAEDIYSVNKSSLKDAIVKFGGGCTGEVISNRGLLLTNHHCGYGRIQSHSSVENDYLTDGFWAMSQSEELPNPGLSVTFIVRIEDVTKEMFDGIDDNTSEEDRKAMLAEHSEAIVNRVTTGNHYEAEVKPFYYGNEYYVIVTEVYKDVRLVGAPPSAVGKYGADTDNWVWPRHTGDFSLFRIYSGPDGKPADYAEENIPLQPRHSFPVSLKGVNAGDFTMVYGFPARTNEYLTSHGVELIQNVEDPIGIDMRQDILDIMEKEMGASDKVRIQYASKQAGVANAWKKWLGRVRGLERDDAIAKKQAEELEFLTRIASNGEWQQAYGGLLTEFERLYKEIRPLTYGMRYFSEAGYATEAFRFANRLGRSLRAYGDGSDEEAANAAVEDMRKASVGHFKNYHAPLDQQVMATLMQSYAEAEEVPAQYRPRALAAHVDESHNGDYNAWAADVFSRSALTDPERFEAMLADFSPEKLAGDPIYSLMGEMISLYFAVQPEFARVDGEIQARYRTYMKALREVYSDKTFYPDANFTLRVTYGKIEGMQPNDGVIYKHYTTLDGVVAKYVPDDREFDLPQKLIDLNEARDYGQYAQDGELRVCFIASNHTSGGNSGSPVINGEGHLIGLNFDRNWEGTMSDVNYDVNQCRNISVDVRYVLFIIDKYAGAGYLIDEMELVK